MVPIYLSEIGSSLVQLVLVLGIGMMVPLVFSPQSGLHRAMLFAVAGLLTARYLWWRATETLAPAELSWDCIASWSFFALELGAGVSSLSAFFPA